MVNCPIPEVADCPELEVGGLGVGGRGQSIDLDVTHRTLCSSLQINKYKKKY